MVFGWSEEEKRREQLRKDAAAAAGTYTQKPADPFVTGMQRSATQQLQQAALGKGPSAASELLQQGAERARRGAQSMVAGATGANKALAFRAAQDVQSRATQDVATQQAALRAQEQQRAMQQFGNILAQQRQAGLGEQQLAAQNYQAQLQASLSQDKDNWLEQQLVSGGSGGISALGGGLVASDKTLKENIKDEDCKMEAFLKALKPQSWEYKQKKEEKPAMIAHLMPKGKHFGVMAQDLESSDVGKTMVIKGPDDKLLINSTKATGPILGALAMMFKKQKELEKKLK